MDCAGLNLDFCTDYFKGASRTRGKGGELKGFFNQKGDAAAAACISVSVEGNKIFKPNLVLLIPVSFTDENEVRV